MSDNITPCRRLVCCYFYSIYCRHVGFDQKPWREIFSQYLQHCRLTNPPIFFNNAHTQSHAWAGQPSIARLGMSGFIRGSPQFLRLSPHVQLETPIVIPSIIWYILDPIDFTKGIVYICHVLFSQFYHFGEATGRPYTATHTTTYMPTVDVHMLRKIRRYWSARCYIKQ